MTVTAEREKALLESVPTGLLIDGEWRDASSGKTFDVKDPATGSSLALMADILAQLPGDDVLPVNAVNAVFGAPVVMVILIRWYREAEAT